MRLDQGAPAVINSNGARTSGRAIMHQKSKFTNGFYSCVEPQPTGPNGHHDSTSGQLQLHQLPYNSPLPLLTQLVSYSGKRVNSLGWPDLTQAGYIRQTVTDLIGNLFTKCTCQGSQAVHNCWTGVVQTVAEIICMVSCVHHWTASSCTQLQRSLISCILYNFLLQHSTTATLCVIASSILVHVFPTTYCIYMSSIVNSKSGKFHSQFAVIE